MSNSNEREREPDEDDHEICLLCDSPITYVYINQRKMIRMCLNANCEYPFGNEDIQKVIHDIISAYEEAAPRAKA